MLDEKHHVWIREHGPFVVVGDKIADSNGIVLWCASTTRSSRG